MKVLVVCVMVATVTVVRVQAQLGESETNTTAVQNSLVAITSSSQSIEDRNTVPGNGDLPEGDVRAVGGVFSWRPVVDTFQGCLGSSYINDTFNYLNLSQVAEIFNASSKEEACLRVCWKQEAFTPLLSVGLAHDSGGGDACGCHYHHQIQPQFADISQEICTLPNLAVYCGPGNMECLSGSPDGCGVSLILLLLMLFWLTTPCKHYGC